MSKIEYNKIIEYLQQRIEAIDQKIFILMVSFITNLVLTIGILITLVVGT